MSLQIFRQIHCGAIDARQVLLAVRLAQTEPPEPRVGCEGASNPGEGILHVVQAAALLCVPFSAAGQQCWNVLRVQSTAKVHMQGKCHTL